MDKTFVEDMELESEVEAANICLVGFDESVHGSVEMELFGYCSSDMGKSLEVDQKVCWKSRVPFISFSNEIGRQRGAGSGWENDEREQTLHQLLAEMDGSSGNTEVSVLAATNWFDDVDSGLLRPGRLDRYLSDDIIDNVENYMWGVGMLEWPKRKTESHVNFKFKSRFWEFDMWVWRKRKERGGTECKHKYEKWNFDIWRWPLRKKEGRTNVEGYMDQIESWMSVFGGVWVNGSFATMRVFPQKDFDGLLAAARLLICVKIEQSLSQ